MEKLNLEEYKAFKNPMNGSVNVTEYNLQKLAEKINEIVSWINAHKDQLLEMPIED